MNVFSWQNEVDGSEFLTWYIKHQGGLTGTMNDDHRPHEPAELCRKGYGGGFSLISFFTVLS